MNVPSHRKMVETRGCIDLGSSYFRLLVVRGVFGEGTYTALPHRTSRPGTGDRAYHDVHPGRSDEHAGYEAVTVHEDKRYIGWGADLEATGSLKPRSVSAAADALAELVSVARSCGCCHPVIAGTNALRAARNRGDAIRALQGRVSLPIHVLSAKGEAAMGLRGASTLLAAGSSAVLIDPGGTSTEVSWGRGGVLHGFVSVPWGTHRIARLLGRFPHTLRGMRTALYGTMGRELGDIDPRAPSGDDLSHLSAAGEITTILATGGTAVSLAICKRYMRGGAAEPAEMVRVTVCDMNLIGRRLCALFGASRHRLIPLDPERIELIIPGLLLLRWIVVRIGAPFVRVTTRDLRWGIVMSGETVIDRDQTADPMI